MLMYYNTNTSWLFWNDSPGSPPSILLKCRNHLKTFLFCQPKAAMNSYKACPSPIPVYRSIKIEFCSKYVQETSSMILKGEVSCSCKLQPSYLY